MNACRPYRTRIISYAYPALKGWAKLFRLAARDWNVRDAIEVHLKADRARLR